MDIPQARTLLQKIAQLVDNLDNNNSRGSRLERDLLLEYTRRLYETLSMEPTASETPSTPSSTVAGPPEIPVATTPSAAPLHLAGSISDSAESEPEVFGSAAPSSDAGSSSPIEVPSVGHTQPSTSPEVHVEPPVPQADPDPLPAPPPAVSVPLSTHVHPPQDASPLFVFQEARDLGDKLRLSRVEDLSKAMGINERFLTINELFGGNHETFDKVLRHLNALASFDDARRYLEQEIIPAFGWLEDKKQKKASIFIQLVQRRYL